MDLDEKEKQRTEHLQRDKELRAGILNSVFTRLTCVGAEAIAGIAAYLSRKDLLRVSGAIS